ncbi:NYN domain-containing protein [Psychromarinibacter halotolerans]|uniref:RNase NYN domain-containing protein n=1 Tax=Psychromarinibacter halotolerans TaxID=1775175 RepID=A0ABV7GMF2_9RHOB|nr:hypothetical protein [Psychromarinibacter halotolerans]MDF0597329.1 hypothetical protein [Psychromarinibacter halotolerans]
MIAPLLIFFVSVAGIAVALLRPEYSDFLLLAGPSAAASLVLCLAALWRRRPGRSGKSRPVIVIDGSNVMHWDDGTPSLKPVKALLDHLARSGYSAGIVFDANAGYKLFGRHMNDQALARMLSLKTDHVLVVPRGTPADPFILDAARKMNARVVTNDRFRDWADGYPEVRSRDYLIRGSFRSGQLTLELTQPA